jgi:paraquat-inducible protein B
MKKSKDKLPQIVRMVDGKAVPVSPDEVRNLRFVAGQSQPLPEPPSELEELRGKVNFYKRNLRRVNQTLTGVLEIATIQESKYVDAILGLAQAKAGDTQQQTQESAAKPKKPNAQIKQRAMIWRDLRAWMKLGNVTPKPKECIVELKKKPAYKNMKISTKRMGKILDEGFDGIYEDILKNI